MELASAELRRFDYNESPILQKRLFVVISDVAEDLLALTRASAEEKAWAGLALRDPMRMSKRMSLAVLRGPLLDGVTSAIEDGASVEAALDAVSANGLVERVRAICSRYAREA